MAGIKSLMESGLKNGVDFKLFNAKSHTSAIASVLMGESAAAITTYTPLKQMTDQSILEKVRFFETKISMPHLFTLAHKNINQALYEKLLLKLKQFEYDPQGLEFFKSTGYIGYTEITPNDISNLHSLMEETKKILSIKEQP
jgi:phosphonate transport system substrate-binding protein